MSIILDLSLIPADARVTSSGTTFPKNCAIQAKISLIEVQNQYMRNEKTFENELLASSEDIGEGLKEEFEFFDVGISVNFNRNRSAAELYSELQCTCIPSARIHCFTL